MKYYLPEVIIGLRETERGIKKKIFEITRLNERNFRYTIVKKSLIKGPKGPLLSCGMIVETTDFIRDTSIRLYSDPKLAEIPSRPFKRNHPVVVGAGLFGLCCALGLARAGQRPIILEQGDSLIVRKRLLTMSRVKMTPATAAALIYGEGGVAAFGGATIRTDHLDPYGQLILETLISYGLDPNVRTNAITYIDAKTTYKLVTKLRDEIISLGGTIIYRAKFSRFKSFLGTLKTIYYIQEGEEKAITTDRAYLCFGLKDDDLTMSLFHSGLKLRYQDFRIGLTLEVPQRDVNKYFYGTLMHDPAIPWFSFEKTIHSKNGVDVTIGNPLPHGKVSYCSAGTGKLQVMTNEPLSTDSENCVFSVYARFAQDQIKTKLGENAHDFIEDLLHAGWKRSSPFGAPSETLGDFLSRKEPLKFGKVKSTYRPSSYLADLSQMMPDFISDAFLYAFVQLAKEYDFLKNRDAVLTGMDIGSTLPYCLASDAKRMTKIKGLYAAGVVQTLTEDFLLTASDGLKLAILSLGEVKTR